ncbi:MAG: hypothetical protein ACRC2G_09205 [Aestuariivirga sp.]
MRALNSSIGLTAAALAGLAFVLPAQALEIEQLLGRWSDPDLDECVYADDSEGAPLNIRREGDEIYVGNYGWLCSVPLTAWKKDGAFFIGEARDCGMEGGDDTFDEVLVLGLNDKDQLLLTKDPAAKGLRRCPAAP